MKMCNLLKFSVITAVAVIFSIACENQNYSGDGNYAITSLSADGSTDDRTTKLIITTNSDKFELTADDIKINANFSVIKGELTKTDTMIYELFITSGSTGAIKIGLDPYRGFTGWNAKTVNVYADWHFSGTSELTITGKDKPGYSLQIPPEIAGIPVTSIGYNAFNNKELEEVDIPHSITAIGDNAFFYNKLTEIDIPDSVKTIGNNAFAYNQLTNVTIPEGIERIRDNTFAFNQLSVVIIPGSVTMIGSGAFAYNQLSNINIPDNIMIIGSNVFAHNQLTDVTIPDKITTIGSSTFEYNNLSKIIIPDSVKNIGIFAFYNNPLTSITIGADVTLGSSSFGYGFESVYNIDKAAGTYTRPAVSWELSP